MSVGTKIIGVGLVVLILAGGVTACVQREKVPAGNVGVKVNLYGSDKGVDLQTLSPGRYWIGWNEELYLFPTFTQNVTWKRIDENDDQQLIFQDKDGLRISAPVSMTYSVDRGKAALLFQKYRRGIDEITDPVLKNMIVGALNAEASLLTVDQINGPGKEELIAKVQARIKQQVAPVGINVERIEWFGPMTLPEKVQASLNEKIQANQITARKENQVRSAEADAKIREANATGIANARTILAKSEADANRIIAASVTSELISYKAADKWNGALPQYQAGELPKWIANK